MAILPPLQHGQDTLNACISLVGHHDWVGALLVQIPGGRYGPPKLRQFAWVPFLQTFSPEPEILPSLHAVIFASDDTTLKALQVVRTITGRRVLD